MFGNRQFQLELPASVQRQYMRHSCPAFIFNSKEEFQMKKLNPFVAVLLSAAMAGCISIGSREPGPQGPPGPKGEPGSSEKVIVVPEKQY
jgi:hypothetical protein